MTFSDILNTGSLEDIANWLDTQTSEDRLKAVQTSLALLLKRKKTKKVYRAQLKE